MKKRFVPVVVFCLCLFVWAPMKAQDPEPALRKLSTSALLECWSFKFQCAGDHFDWESELVRRSPTVTLIRAFNRAPLNGDGAALRESIKTSLYLIACDRDDARIYSFMRTGLDNKTEQGDYYAALYMAKKGDKHALSILSQNCWEYSISSSEWAEALNEFGNQRYRAAIPCLIESAYAASLNAADAAYQSLVIFYPDSPRDLPSPKATQEYFEKRYAQERARPHKQ